MNIDVKSKALKPTSTMESMIDPDTFAILKSHTHKLSRQENIYLLKRCISFFKPYKLRISIALLSMLIVSLSSAATAYLIKPAMDKIFLEKNVTYLMLVPIAYVIVAISQSVFRVTQTYCMESSGYLVLQTLREKLFSKIICLPTKFYENNPVGKLMGLVLSDIDMIKSSLPTVVDMVRQIFTMLGLICVVFYQNASLAIWAVIVLPICFFPFFYFGRRIRKLSRKNRSQSEDIVILLQELFSGIRIVKTFSTEKPEVKNFIEKNKKVLDIVLKQTMFSSITSSTMELIGAIGIGFVIFYGGGQVISGAATPGTFFSFVAALIMLYDPVKKLSNANNNLQNALVGAERVFMILDSKVLTPEQGGNVILNPNHLTGSEGFETLEFKDINLRYQSGQNLALNNINFTIKKGEKVALVGPSGAGKSSFINLIPRFYEAESGQILLNNINLKDYDITSLRHNISIVSQDNFLFNVSIADNICYGDNNRNFEKLEMAAKAAFADKFIKELPNGYDTLVGERGVKLSGGQKQRITIARAIFKDAPLLILDEATSALDSESEKIVQKALENLMKNRTSIVIAHRLSTILSSDRIFVMDRGKIVDIGTHEELLQKSKLYIKLYNMQFEAALQ
ncbi:ABC transporter ATP-binding protein [Desulfovibrio litoralis]|uniref:ATP-binding cassette, subfamily B, MsbA n=1 Tax=Desulfovibrio litoralis DSM 11393 TaxID=1121455 RepID=A0A1M7SXJ4_9BACT|nr:ABC transporter transmembrane domain-containing protein [Desulfovibrio litoralis]SHN63094.1 ATP-binding cassette, subfamily B, MsbA [Desulfovibrio litoralis DSM 11393]